MIRQVGKNFVGVHVANQGSFGNSYLHDITPLTMQIFTLAMHSVTGNAVGVIAKRQKRGHIAVSD